MIFIFLTAGVVAFICGRNKDRCLKDFSGTFVVLELKDGKRFSGILRLETSGIELLFRSGDIGQGSSNRSSSYILYKKEFPLIQKIIRYVDAQGKEEARIRKKHLRSISSSGGSFKVWRRIRNVIGTIRDSFMELATLLLGRTKNSALVGKTVSGQEKYIAQMQNQALTYAGTSYEPIIERYIGRKVILVVDGDAGVEEYVCVLKEYSPDLIEVMDVDHADPESGNIVKTDMIVPRSMGAVKFSAINDRS